MCERSNRPAAARTARCSSRIPAYWIGISQPANSTIFAPSASWRSSSGVGIGCRRGGLGHGSRPSAGRRARKRAIRRGRGGAGDQRPLRLEGEQRRGLVEPDPADLVELVVVAPQVAAGRDHQEVVDGLVDAGPALDEGVVDPVERADDAHVQAGLLANLAQGGLLAWSRAGWACPWAASRSRRRARAGACRRPAAGDPSTNRMTMPPAEVAVACFRRATRAPGRAGAARRPGPSSSRTSAGDGWGRPLRTGRAGATTSVRHGARSAVSGPTSGLRSTVRWAGRGGEHGSRVRARGAAPGPGSWGGRTAPATPRSGPRCCAACPHRTASRVACKCGAEAFGSFR